jgi:asparagine synthase (glutamine-hydrolysing)
MGAICGSTNDPEGRAVAAMSAALADRAGGEPGSYRDSASATSLAARGTRAGGGDGLSQPIGSEDASVWAILDGEIYNRGELREHLLRRRHQISTAADAELLVHLYEEYDDALVHAIDGSYALAVWDATRRRLILARDRFGQKPLAYMQRGRDLWFASRASALREAAPAQLDVDPEAVSAFLAGGSVAAPASIWRGVHQLPPASVLTSDASTSGSPSARSYWALPVGQRLREPLAKHAAEAETVLTRAVRACLDPARDVGFVLDDGDVGDLLAVRLAAGAATRPVKSFRVRYGDSARGPRSSHAAEAELHGTEYHEVALGDDEVAEMVPTLLSELDQPLARPAMVSLHAAARLAGGHVDAVIASAGAKELFGAKTPAGADPMWLGRFSGATLAACDQATTLAGVDICLPYLHRDVAEFAPLVPPDIHAWAGGQALLRHLLALKRAEAAETAGHDPPVGAWLRGPLAGLVERHVLNGTGCEAGWLNRDELAPVVSEHLRGLRDRSRVLWPALVLGVWLDAQ